MTKLKVGLISLLASSILFGGEYVVDPSHTNVGFTVKHMMVSKVSGKFNKFSGEFEYDEKANKLKSVSGEIEVNSIDTANSDRDTHLKSDEILDAAKFGKITFKSTKVTNDAVYGDITIKGVTKNIKLALENGGTAEGRAGFSMMGKIKRSEFGVTWNRVIEAGGVAVSDEVTLNVDVEGKKED